MANLAELNFPELDGFPALPTAREFYERTADYQGKRVERLEKALREQHRDWVDLAACLQKNTNNLSAYGALPSNGTFREVQVSRRNVEQAFGQLQESFGEVRNRFNRWRPMPGIDPYVDNLGAAIEARSRGIQTIRDTWHAGPINEPAFHGQYLRANHERMAAQQPASLRVHQWAHREMAERAVRQVRSSENRSGFRFDPPGRSNLSMYSYHESPSPPNHGSPRVLSPASLPSSSGGPQQRSPRTSSSIGGGPTHTHARSR